jgi:hypothetical protein
LRPRNLFRFEIPDDVPILLGSSEEILLTANNHDVPVVETGGHNRGGRPMTFASRGYAYAKGHLLSDIHRNEMIGPDQFLIVNEPPAPGHSWQTGCKARSNRDSGHDERQTPHHWFSR